MIMLECYVMMQPTASNQTTYDLEHALDEMDRLVHRSKALLQHVRKPSIEERLRAWESGCGLLKGKITEDPVAYQRRIRDEEDI